MSTKTRAFDRNLLILGAFACVVFVVYLYFINLSIDTIILFLSNKIFLANALRAGSIPWFNPHIFLGVPFMYDIGLGNFHPFNLFFLLPMPYSFALWVSVTTFMLLVGFYVFLKRFTKTPLFALLLTYTLFFSGTGAFRINNPTIYIVIAHYGFFFWSLQFLKKRSHVWIPLAIGTLLTLSGHFQFVVYGYILAFFIAIRFYKIPLKNIILFFIGLGMVNSWYFVLALPLVFESTRLTMKADYTAVGNNSILHFMQVVLPFIWGHLSNGSKWQVGPTYTVLISYCFTLFLAITYKRKYLVDYIVLGFILIASLGYINIPFLRNAGQIMTLFHMIGLILLAQEERTVMQFLVLKKKNVFIILVGSMLIFVSGAVFFISALFPRLFFYALAILHKNPGLFYDAPTVHQMGMLVGQSMLMLAFFVGVLLVIRTLRRYAVMLLIVYVCIEGIIIQYAFNFYIPTRVLTSSPLSTTLNTNDYRIQGTPDVIPYHGVSFYMSDVILQPPFSKERPYVDAAEKRTFANLSHLFNLFPSTWVMTSGYNAVQGFDTFITRDIATYFAAPSPDFTTEYADIIKRNAYFGKDEQKTVINGIETSRITFNDPRWEKLGVKYIVSDRPLKKYKLVEKKGGRYVYENEYTLPIYRLVSGDLIVTKHPSASTPNGWEFVIAPDEAGQELQIVVNPGGFVATRDAAEVRIVKEKLLMRIPNVRPGLLKVSYSPVRHLQETLGNRPQLFK